MFYELGSHVFMVAFSFQSLRSDCAVLILLLNVASLVGAWIFSLKIDIGE